MNYTVLGIEGEPRTWNSEKGGAMLAYSVRFTEHSDKLVEWSRKASGEAPTAGQSVDGTIDWQGKFGPRFKQEFQQKGGGDYPGRGTWKPRDPAETAAIQRQHSQGLAVRTAVAAGWFQDFDPEDDAGKAKLALVSRLATWFQRDIARGVKVAAEDAKTTQTYGQRKELEPTGTPDVSSEGAPVHQKVPEDSLPWTGGEAA